MKAGLPPGSLVFTGQRRLDNSVLRMVTYDAEVITDEAVSGIRDLKVPVQDGTSVWLNIDGVHDSALMHDLGELFGLSPMLLEVVQDPGQRPGLTEYQDCVFINMKVFYEDAEDGTIEADQVCAVLGDNFLITFQERTGDVFEAVRVRLSRQNAKIRQKGVDYLLYAILDCLFENYLSLIEKIGDRIEDMEEDVIDNPESELLEEIHFYRQEIAYMRKSVRPARDIVSRLNRMESDLFAESTFPYLKELAVISEQVVDSVEIYKEMLGDLYSTYNMAISTRLNETMKFLTVFATIFIPLTFLAGIYGMNFDFIPELRFRYGYFALLGLMFVIACAMLIYFKKKKWI